MASERKLCCFSIFPFPNHSLQMKQKINWAQFFVANGIHIQLTKSPLSMKMLSYPYFQIFNFIWCTPNTAKGKSLHGWRRDKKFYPMISIFVTQLESFDFHTISIQRLYNAWKCWILFEENNESFEAWKVHYFNSPLEPCCIKMILSGEQFLHALCRWVLLCQISSNKMFQVLLRWIWCQSHVLWDFPEGLCKVAFHCGPF